MKAKLLVVSEEWDDYKGAKYYVDGFSDWETISADELKDVRQMVSDNKHNHEFGGRLVLITEHDKSIKVSLKDWKEKKKIELKERERKRKEKEKQDLDKKMKKLAKDKEKELKLFKELQKKYEKDIDKNYKTGTI